MRDKQIMMSIEFWIAGVGTVANAAAAFLWLRSAVILVPDNIDTFIGELQRMGRWNAAGAAAASIGAACFAFLFYRQAI